MGAPRNVSLLANYTGGTSNGAKFFWHGGRTCAVLAGGMPATNVKIQMMGQDGSWLDVQTITLVGVVSFDAPSGTYRAQVNGAGASALYVDLCSVGYN